MLGSANTQPLGVRSRCLTLNSQLLAIISSASRGAAAQRNSISWRLGSSRWSSNQGSDGDFDLDGDVDGADFLTWQQGFGNSYDAEDLAAVARKLRPVAGGSRQCRRRCQPSPSRRHGR